MVVEAMPMMGVLVVLEETVISPRGVLDHLSLIQELSRSPSLGQRGASAELDR